MDFENTALMVIDVQNGMFTDPNYPVYKGSELLDTIQQVIGLMREKSVPIIYIQHNEGENTPLDPNTPGFDVHPQIAPQSGDHSVTKTRADSFYNTDLKMILDKLGIKKLIITGLQTEFCVDTTCRVAKSFDYDLFLVQNGHSTFDSPHLKASDIIAHHNYVLDGSFVKLVNIMDLQ